MLLSLTKEGGRKFIQYGWRSNKTSFEIEGRTETISTRAREKEYYRVCELQKPGAPASDLPALREKNEREKNAEKNSGVVIFRKSDSGMTIPLEIARPKPLRDAF